MNDYRAYVENDYNSLYHYGIRGQKWGIRRYQNPDGSLTPEGRARYLNPDGSLNERGRRELGRQYLKDRKYAGRVAGGLLGTAATAGIVGAKRMRDSLHAQDMVGRYERKQFGMRNIGKAMTSGVSKKDVANLRKVIKNEDDIKKFSELMAMEGFDDATKKKLMEHAAKKKNVIGNEIHNQALAKKYMNDVEKIENSSLGKRATGIILAAGIGATAIGLYFHHKGVQKRKAEVERMLMGSDKSDSSTTKRAKDDWKNMSDKEFRQKYGVSKDKYAKRVAKYRDPYMNAPLARLGKSLSGKKTGNNQRGFAGEVPSLKDIRTQQNKQGRVPTIKETVERQNSFGRAPSIIPNFVTDNFSKAESMALSRGSDYYVAYDPNLGGFIVRRRGR